MFFLFIKKLLDCFTKFLENTQRYSALKGVQNKFQRLSSCYQCRIDIMLATLIHHWTLTLKPLWIWVEGKTTFFQWLIMLVKLKLDGNKIKIVVKLNKQPNFHVETKSAKVLYTPVSFLTKYQRGNWFVWTKYDRKDSI